jgi:hypothetical protein
MDSKENEMHVCVYVCMRNPFYTDKQFTIYNIPFIASI